MHYAASLPIQLFVRDARQGKPETTAEVIREMEDMGYWGLGCSHHLSDPGLSALGHAGGEEVNWRYADPIAILSYFAALSRKARLIPWVIVLPYRQPVELAHGLATIDVMSNGRLVFGAGTGSRHSEFDLVAMPRDQRGRITDEWLDVVIALWTNPKASYDGEHYRFEDVTLAVRPLQEPRPPIWIGGGARAALKRAIKYGEVWAPPAFNYAQFQEAGEGGASGSVTAARLRDDLRWANEQRSALGKPPLEGAVGNGVPLKFTDTPQHKPGYSRKDVAYFTCRGTPGELLEEFAAYKEAGAKYFMMKFTGDTISEYLRDAETFAREIMPALK